MQQQENSKRGQVRAALLKLPNGRVFTINGLATAIGVDYKAVSNEIGAARKGGVDFDMKDVQGATGKQNAYTVDSNALALHYARSNGKLETTLESVVEPLKVTTTKPKTQRRVRPPFIMAVDVEIAKLQAKIKKLEAVRKEFG